MQKIGIVTKFISTACAVIIGMAVSLFFLQDLLQPTDSGPAGDASEYTLLISDSIASLVAGVLAGWLAHFCLWDCLASWVGNLWRRIRQTCQAAHASGPANKAGHI